MSLLSIRDLRVQFESGQRVIDAVRGMSLDIRRGELLALVGESGSGKSVTAQAVMRLLPQAASLSGSMVFDGHDLATCSEATMRGLRGKRIAMIFQEPMSALNPLHGIGRQITEIITTHQSLKPDAVQARVKELLAMVGLTHFSSRLDAFPHQLSGGERQRVMIAMAMANQPDLLIADEPTTALDVTLQKQILDLLVELQAQHGMAILLITHDLTIVKRLAHRVAIMKQGEIVEQGDKTTVFTNPQHAYTRTLLGSAPSGSPLPLPANADTVLSCESVKVHFPIKQGWLGLTRGHTRAVDGISLQVKQGQTVGIVGESGSGKSTLALALLRLIKAEGSVVFLRRPLEAYQGRSLRQLRRNMQIIFQDPYGSLNPRLSIGQIIGEGLRVHHPEIGREDRRERVRSMLEQIGMERDMFGRFPHEFSGGQRQRISIARAMILRPSLVILDEPTSALDLTVQSQILELLKHFQQQDRLAYLFISHDLRVIRAISHEVLVMHQGKVVEHQPTEALFATPQHDYTKALLSALA